MRLGLACLAVSAAVIAGVWAWLGAPVPMPQSPLAAGEKLYCLSYAPFRGGQTPLDLATHISPAQIEDDLSRLAKITDCVRTYSVDFGLDQIAGIAAHHGLKVMQGLWLSSHADLNQVQIETAVALANRYPGTIRAVVVGNEVLLRGEMSAEDLAATLRAVKARVAVPVTYADVWEFWLQNRDVASAADFITIHILPYWEDFPIPARNAAAHVDSIRRRVLAAFPGKEVIIGEVGWPSAGRMREGALPSPVNQARVIQDVLALGKRENFRVNVIEAFDEPCERIADAPGGGTEQAREPRQRRAAYHRRAQARRRQQHDNGEGQRAQPAAGAERFNRHIGDAPADQRAAGDRVRRHCQPKRWPSLAPHREGRAEHDQREQNSNRRLHLPIGMIGDRFAPHELGSVRRIVEQAPMAADGAFERALPRLVEGFDHVDAEIFAFAQRQHVLDDARLVHRRRQRALAHTPGARPADFADDHFLAGKGGQHAAADRVHMRG